MLQNSLRQHTDTVSFNLNLKIPLRRKENIFFRALQIFDNHEADFFLFKPNLFRQYSLLEVPLE